jgi:hypothetical protein
LEKPFYITPSIDETKTTAEGALGMKKLTTCLLIFLVAVSLTLTMVPIGSSQVSTVKIVSYSYYVDSLGYLDVVGEVQNTGPNTIDYVIVTGIVSSSDGAQSNSGIQVWGKNLTPGQKAPFYLEFHSESTTDGTWYGTDITNVQLEVSEAPATAQYQYSSLTLTSQKGTVSAHGEFFLDCDVKNTGSQTASNAIICATFYNSTGQVVAVGYSNQSDISPQSTVHLRAGAFDLNQSTVPSDKKISTYSALIQVSGPLLEGAAPVAVATPTPGPIVVETPGPDSGNTGGDGSGSDVSGGSDQNLPLAAGIVVVIVVVVVALLLLTRRGKSKAKSEVAPTKLKASQRKAKTKRK